MKSLVVRPFTLPEFGALLSRVGVEDELEHQNLFAAIRDPHGANLTVTLEMLAAAMSAISPSLLLEDVYDTFLNLIVYFFIFLLMLSLLSVFLMIRASKGLAGEDPEEVRVSLKLLCGLRYGPGRPLLRVKALCSLEDSLDVGEFIRYAVPAWKLTAYEAAKVFRLIDVDGSLEISQDEFVTALTLSEPNLYLDDIRRKVRQRFRGLRELLSDTDELKSAEPPKVEIAASRRTSLYQRASVAENDTDAVSRSERRRRVESFNCFQGLKGF